MKDIIKARRIGIKIDGVVYLMRSKDESTKALVSVIDDSIEGCKPKFVKHKCRCEHCGKIQVAPWIEWRLYGLCKECRYDRGKQIYVDDIVISQMVNGKLHCRWGKPGGKQS
jgi:hypothetical protein